MPWMRKEGRIRWAKRPAKKACGNARDRLLEQTKARMNFIHNRTEMHMVCRIHEFKDVGNVFVLGVAGK
jgi:hypothetical protein